MKIRCDVCNKDDASVFCSADEAALCDGCDQRVHHANKLAGKHQRFSLLQPCAKEFPLCDICQEKRAFLFCQQDRAILCKDCDIPIHKANEHTMNHNRFLLTGVKLSATSEIYSSSTSNSSSIVAKSGCVDVVPDFNMSQRSSNKHVASVITTPTVANPPPCVAKDGKKSNNNAQMIVNGASNNGSMSSISEYLIETLPGWHVEDFLDSSSTPNGFSKTGENDVLPFWDDDLEGNLSSFTSEKMGIWVPQAPPPLYPTQSYPSSNMAFSGQICFKNPKETTTNIKANRKWRDDGGFTVPQISPTPTASKRSRNFW